MLHNEPSLRCPLFYRSALGALCLLALVALVGCKRAPTRGAYAVRIVAIANTSKVVPGATVLIHGQRVGHTDAFGVYRGKIRGQVGSQVPIQVIGKGANNKFSAKVRLRVKRSDEGWVFVPIHIKAVMWSPKKAKGLATNLQPQRFRPLDLASQRPAPRQLDRTSTTSTDRRSVVKRGNSTATPSLPPTTTGAKKTQCFRQHRGAHRVVALHGPPGSLFSLIGDCIERVGKAAATGKVAVSLPIGQFVRFMVVFPNGKSVRKVVEVRKAAAPLMLHFSSKSNKCNLTAIRSKLRNRILLERAEINCLKQERKGSPHYFSAWLFLGRAFCTHKKWRDGIQVLDTLHRDPRNRRYPYRALQLGIEYSRCRKPGRAIPLLKHAASQVHRMAVADRYANQKALHSALSGLYEQRFRRRKRAADLNLSLKHAHRLAEITMSREPAYCRKVLKEVKRLKVLVNRYGDLDE